MTKSGLMCSPHDDEGTIDVRSVSSGFTPTTLSSASVQSTSTIDSSTASSLADGVPISSKVIVGELAEEDATIVELRERLLTMDPQTRSYLRKYDKREYRRRVHVMSEHKRRVNINESLILLQRQLPHLEGERLSRLAIVQASMCNEFQTFATDYWI